MNKLDENIKLIVDFIYEKPEYVVRLLQKYGYKIDLKTATLQQIDELTFSALQANNKEFAYDLSEMIINDGYYNIVVAIIGAVVALASAVIGSNTATRNANRERELMWNLKMAELAQQEKLVYEQIRTQAETERIRILANSMRLYREALQKESTIRLRDTWIYVAMIGCTITFLFALKLINSKPQQA